MRELNYHDAAARRRVRVTGRGIATLVYFPASGRDVDQNPSPRRRKQSKRKAIVQLASGAHLSIDPTELELLESDEDHRSEAQRSQHV